MMNDKKFLKNRLEPLLASMRDRTLLVIGDVMLDEYIWGKVNRISPEAPVPVVQVTKESACPGGAANVARNLADFSIPVHICGLVGRDGNGRRLCSLLSEAQIKNTGLVVKREFTTIVKTRIIARQQQVVRVDREGLFQLTDRDLGRIRTFLKKNILRIDAIIIEDYGKGLIRQELVDLVISLALEHGKPVSVDPNSNNPLDWSGATLVKPNRQEAFAAAGLPLSKSQQDLHQVGRILLEKWQVPMVLITMGEGGMVLFRPNRPPYTSPTRAREVYDVSGAGDTVIAFFTAAWAAGATAEEATEIANHAAGVVVGKIGTATLSASELINSFRSHE